MNLSEIKPGEKVIIEGFKSCNRNYRDKLLRMGIIKGEIIELIKKAPFGDPFTVKIKGSSLILRKTEAEVLNVKRI